MNISESAQAAADKWNRSVQIGSEVEYSDHSDMPPKRFRTRTEAEVMSGHTAVVWLEGKSGCVNISSCRKVTP